MATDLRERLQSTLGNAYTLERELGGGGMSRVFVADETAFGRKVVVKVLPPDLAAGVSVDRFKREIQVAARLQHPHIVPVLSAGESDGLPFYTMPFVEGSSLRARLGRGGLLITEVVGVLREVARALAYDGGYFMSSLAASQGRIRESVRLSRRAMRQAGSRGTATRRSRWP